MLRSIMAVALAASVSTVVSFLWYGLFLKKGSRVTTEEEIKGNHARKMGKVVVTSFLANIFSATAIFIIIESLGIRTLSGSAPVILLLWVMLTSLSGIKKVLIDKKSFENFILGAGHDLVSILASVCVIFFLRK